MKVFFFLLALAWSGADTFAQTAPVAVVEKQTIIGQLREKGTRKPLAGVNIYCFSPSDATVPVKAVTAADGSFQIEVPKGILRWRIALSNYEIYEQIENAGNLQKREFFLEKQSYLVYETTVFGQGEKRDDKTKTLTQEQFSTLPGANGDPVKAVQNLPGVNRGGAFSAQVIIEGSAPSDTKYSIDTQPVPIIFHFAGLSSVVMPEAVDRVDYLSAGFGPEFGQSTSGLVNLYTKDPQVDRLHGLAYMDIFNFGALVEGPVGENGSFLFGVRKSYIGAVLGAVAKNNSNLNFTVAPDFNDSIFMYRNKISATDSFKLVAVGSVDTLGFVLTEPIESDPSIRGSFSQNTSFYRIIPQYTHRFNSDTVSRYWLGFGQDSLKQDFGTLYYHNVATVASGRAELETQLDPSWKSYFGIENVVNWSNIDFQIPFMNRSQSGAEVPIGVAAVQSVSNTYFLDTSSLYWRNSIHAADSRFTYLPGLRLGYYNQTNEVLPEPRLALRYALDQGLTLRGATGLYSQAPPPQDFDKNYGNPNLTSERAIHATIGAEKDFREGGADGWVTSSDLFYKYLTNLVQSSSALTSNGQPEFYNNNGSGRVYGLELLLKYKTHNWSGWLSYTLSKSTRIFPPADEQIFQYDQTHNLNLIAEREFGKNWKFSGRARYTTGNPYTPNVGGNFDVDNDIYLPVAGAAYSQRLEPFFQIDSRLDKKWVYNTWILTGYLDIENITNSKNPQSINYSYNYQRQATITGLPILPTIGVKGEF